MKLTIVLLALVLALMACTSMVDGQFAGKERNDEGNSCFEQPPIVVVAVALFFVRSAAGPSKDQVEAGVKRK